MYCSVSAKLAGTREIPELMLITWCFGFSFHEHSYNLSPGGSTESFMTLDRRNNEINYITKAILSKIDLKENEQLSIQIEDDEDEQDYAAGTHRIEVSIDMPFSSENFSNEDNEHLQFINEVVISGTVKGLIAHIKSLQKTSKIWDLQQHWVDTAKATFITMWNEISDNPWSYD